MNKKIYYLIFAVLLVFILQFIPSHAQEDASQVIGKEFGINASKLPNPDEIPTNPEEIRSKYLQQEWTKILSENKFTKPVHLFFTKVSVVFQILFANPYEISLQLFLIILLWLFFALRLGSWAKSYGLNGFLSLGIGIASATILAQAKILTGLVTFARNLISAQENWWIRLIFWIIIGAIVATLYVISAMVSKEIKEWKKARKEVEAKEEIKQIKAVRKGIKKIR